MRLLRDDDDRLRLADGVSQVARQDAYAAAEARSRCEGRPDGAAFLHGEARKLQYPEGFEARLQVGPVRLRRRQADRQLAARLPLDAHRRSLCHVLIEGAREVCRLIEDHEGVRGQVVHERVG